ncbi:hypothetical protein A4X09_0g7353 [Tilletia walkeri]|uniref:Uncharacterized protein n=1 Tax=Tilletia walkeri TaxID=117179 RepID=A0A8X7N3E4_9BASI|nr:hypothetical protein A4X09_0g7353 [Tilletia walkeri]
MDVARLNLVTVGPGSAWELRANSERDALLGTISLNNLDGPAIVRIEHGATSVVLAILTTNAPTLRLSQILPSHQAPFKITSDKDVSLLLSAIAAIDPDEDDEPGPAQATIKRGDQVSYSYEIIGDDGASIVQWRKANGRAGIQNPDITQHLIGMGRGEVKTVAIPASLVSAAFNIVPTDRMNIKLSE